MSLAAGKKTYEALRRTHPTFIYHSYELKAENGRVDISWHFEIKGLAHFRPRASLPLPASTLRNDPVGPLACRLAFLCGLAELVSYWKITCSPTVEVRAGTLTETEIDWWKDLYFGGLGEFFYLNNIRADRADFMKLIAGPVEEGEALKEYGPHFKSVGLNIIPVGGGKDSVVSLVRLAACREKSLAFGINSTPAAVACMEIAGLPPARRLLVERRLAPEMLDLNEQGYLNGHTPFSAVVAFNALFAAYLIGADRIILSNEASADESSVPGTGINHQFSKTTVFEQAFRSYVQDQLGLSIHYFSLLRPFNELCIAREFAAHPAFFETFRSCNVGSKKNIWCGKCAKCLFIATMLAPFVGLERLEEIFGKAIFADENLQETLDELTGAKPVKAFECVGTVSEVRFALTRLLLQFHPARQPLVPSGETSEFAGHIGRKSGSLAAPRSLPVLLAHFLKQCRSGLFPDLGLDASGFPFNRPGSPSPLTAFHRGHAVPGDLLPCLASMNRPELTDCLCGQKILILGFGREGQAALNWLAVHSGELGLKKVGLADRHEPDSTVVDRLKGSLELVIHTGETYLEALSTYDFILKSPGISFKDYTDRPTGRQRFEAFGEAIISGQTDLLLKAGLPQAIIGVTGTKGKSTTTALIADMLQAQGRSCALAGNIGLPILAAYDSWTADTVIALELSSHQLQFTGASPRVAVITNFYEEHLDHYRSYDEYLSSKLNILRFQAEEDRAVLCADSNELMARALPEVKGRLVLVTQGHLSAAELEEGAEALYLRLAAQLPGDQDRSYFQEHLEALYTYEGHSVERIQAGADGSSLERAIMFSVPADHPALPGLHHLSDAALAAAAVAPFVDDAKLASGILAFAGLPHRSEFVSEVSDIRFYNDSIATIPAATELALKTLPRVRTLIVGGMDRGIDYTDFIEGLANSSVSCLIGLPDTGYKICDALQQKWGGSKKLEPSNAAGQMDSEPVFRRIFKAVDMDEAVQLAYNYTRPGDSCLLSPAASSYNIYKSFEERGNHFKAAVNNLSAAVEPVSEALSASTFEMGLSGGGRAGQDLSKGMSEHA